MGSADRAAAPTGGSGASRASSRAVPRIREATLADLSTVVELRLALLRENAEHPVYGRLRPDVTERALQLFARQLESDSETVFLAERGKEVVGILRCVESVGSPLLLPTRYCYVSSAYVRPAARRSGVLRHLMKRAVAWCRERGLAEMRLHNIPSSEDASAAWDALGFEVVEHVRICRLAAGGRSARSRGAARPSSRIRGHRGEHG